MELPAFSVPIAERLIGATRRVLGSRLAGIVVYGSAATGDIVPGYSDFDCFVILDGPLTLTDAVALEVAIGPVEIAPFSYYQPTFTGTGPARPGLVPGANVVIAGEEPPSDWMLTGDQLSASGEDWLARIPAVFAQDAVDWSMASAASVPRRARLHLTRVKPTLRALLVREGGAPALCWTATWVDLTDGIAAVDGPAAAKLGYLLGAARRRDDRAVAVSALELLGRICAEHLGTGRRADRPLTDRISQTSSSARRASSGP